jgi:hypothetical protein
MKTNLMVFTSICTAILMLTPVASATDPLLQGPERFYGTVTVNGTAVSDGTIVSAWIDNTEIISQATIGGKYGYIPPEPEEFQVYGSEGATIVFKINGVEAGTDILSSSDITQKDLSATGVVTSTPTPAPETSNPSGGGGFASPDATPKPSPTVATTEGNMQLAPPTSAAPPGESGEAAKEPETIPTANQGGTNPSSSIPGFAGVTALFMLLAVIYGSRRNG